MIKRILVPLDFSDPSLQALDRAVELARDRQAEIILLHVIEPVVYPLVDETYGLGFDLGNVYGQIEEAAQARLTKIAADLRARGVKVRTRLENGTAFRMIVDSAAKLKASLIVMSTHGRSGLSHALLGSVAERVLRTASCPVLTVRTRPTRAPRRSTAAARAGRKRQARRR